MRKKLFIAPGAAHLKTNKATNQMDKISRTVIEVQHIEP